MGNEANDQTSPVGGDTSLSPVYRRSAAEVSMMLSDPRLTPWATDLSPLRGSLSDHSFPIDFAEAVIERSAFTSFMTSSAEV